MMWNEFIHTMRMEDLISNRLELLLAIDFINKTDRNAHFLILLCFFLSSRDRDLLLLPFPSSYESRFQWPLFLLASKVNILGVSLVYSYM